ncbi:hypothetical protein [Algibacter mikhailovii]|uniref:DUF4177 domain-containing protein n=1 Tax=Algibacter mikhailovii TaxID=425498 RepID=A0A918QWH4_9FLAO|nr:hypothetical protein [Algibacter mikhailovii]GGZ73032.1 hypothetical protein GCM10007028_07650 [Algibacter mikhailovii]
MKKLLMVITIALFTTIETNAQIEYKIVTSVESIVSSGAGRSRIISANEEKNYQDYTSSQTEEDSHRNKSDRSDIRVKNYDETKLLNFFNIGGIRFQNIAANDAVITSKINTMVADGWELAYVTSAVESDAGKGDGSGIFITRFIFKRNKL